MEHAQQLLLVEERDAVVPRLDLEVDAAARDRGAELRRQLLGELVEVDLADDEVGVAAREREHLARHAGHQIELALDLLDVLLALLGLVGRRPSAARSPR